MEIRLNHVKNTAARDMFPPQLISQGRREGRLGGQGTLYSKRDWVPTPPPLSLWVPAAGVGRPNILLSPNKWKDNALPNLGFGSCPTKLSIMGVSWHHCSLTGHLFVKHFSSRAISWHLFHSFFWIHCVTREPSLGEI